MPVVANTKREVLRSLKPGDSFVTCEPQKNIYGHFIEVGMRPSTKAIQLIINDRVYPAVLATFLEIADRDKYALFKGRRVRSSTITKKLNQYKQAKTDHEASNQCTAKSGTGCTACHFWSSAISALEELTN